MMIAALFALLAGALFGLVSHVQKKGLAHLDDKTGTLVSVATMAAVFWVLAPLMIDWRWWLTEAALLFALCGLVFPAASQRLQILSVVKVGPNMTSAFGSFAPVFAVVPAVLVLGESLSLQVAMGLSIMIAALLISASGPKGPNRTWSAVALLLPLGASFVRGIIQPVAKAGMIEVPSPFFATMVMATVSTVVAGSSLAMRRRPQAGSHTRRGYGWFALNGACVGMGILSMQVALNLGDVIITAPLVSTSPLWTLLLGALIFRHEVLRPRHAIVAVMVMVGVTLIVLG